MDIAAQILSIFGMLFNLLSYQQKAHKRAITFQLLGCFAFFTSYFLLGATVGAILNIVGVFRSLLFLFEEKTNAYHPFWLLLFITFFALSYPLVFLVFDKEPSVKNLIIEILPVIAMIVATLSIRMGSSRAIRYMGLITSPLWLIYNIVCFSIGAIIGEILNFSSIIIGIFRHDVKKKTKEN